MSCSLNVLSFVESLDDVKVSLMPEKKTKQEIYRDDDWDNRWNWDTSQLAYDETNEIEKKNLWLSECLISVSPLMDTLVIGRQKTLSIFNGKQQKNSSKNEKKANFCFKVAYTTFLADLENDETLTSLLLLPFVSQQKSAVSFRDWTAILTGFSSGYFRIYAENGKVLLSHLFHDEPVLDVKCRTYSLNNLIEQIDELLIIYPTAVVQIDGFTLYQTLRANRNRLAKSEETAINSNYVKDQQTPFTFKKWRFETPSDGSIYDCVDVCSYVKNDFDALVSHSIQMDQRLNNLNNNHSTLFLTTGTNPYIGFYRAKEGTTHTILEELSQVLINKVKNVFSFFGPSSVSSKDADNSKEKIKPATDVPLNLALFDERLGFRICISPNRRLAAIIDDFGRVILFDMQNMIALRIWKGYRKAEVGWVVVPEEKHKKNSSNLKQASFLVIYAPKRGILEIWCCQNGPRVSAFKVGKNCKLFYLNHTMFGLNSVILQTMKQAMPQQEFFDNFSDSKCFLFNFENGKLFTVDIPFICALTDRSGKKTRDIHILKDLKILLNKKDEEQQPQEHRKKIIELMLMLKTAEIRRECLDLLCTLNDAEFIATAAQHLIDNLIKIVNSNGLDFENKLVIQMAVRIAQLCRCYTHIHSLKKSMIEKNIQKVIAVSQNPPDIQHLTERLGDWSGNDVTRLLSLLAFQNSVIKSEDFGLALSNEVVSDLTISEMLSHFTLYYTYLFKNEQNEEFYEKLPTEIILMIDQKNSKNPNKTFSNKASLEKLSRFLLVATFCDDNEDEVSTDSNLKYLIEEVNISSSNLLILLFTAWLASSLSDYWPCWIRFAKAFFIVTRTIRDSNSIDCEKQEKTIEPQTQILDFTHSDGHLSFSWMDIISLIYNSPNIASAFVAINMIKTLVSMIKKRESIDKQMESTVESSTLATLASDNEWETLHLDEENLSLVTKQLEDLFLLNLLLKSDSSHKNSKFKNLNSSDTSIEDTDNISLFFILNHGPSVVSELVARWAVHNSIEPDLLCVCPIGLDANLLNEEISNKDKIILESEVIKNIDMASNAAHEMSVLKEKSTLIEILDHVRRCFPSTLDGDILLINCFWEILLEWNQKPLIMTGDLPKALQYLNKVSSSVLKHNVASMGWCLFVQKRFEVFCNLVEKMGKKPKDRISRNELNMDENNLEQFVLFCCDLLDFLIRTSVSSETEPLPLFTTDDYWLGFNSANHYNNVHYSDDLVTRLKQSYSLILKKDNSQQKFLTTGYDAPLAIMAMHQKSSNVNLLIELYHLSLSVQFIVLFGLHNARPLSLFSSTVRAFFFKDLHTFVIENTTIKTLETNDSSPKKKLFKTANVNLLTTDPELDKFRLKFLFNVIVGIVKTLPVCDEENGDLSASQTLYVTANRWFGTVVTLAREWNLNVDNCRLHYVYYLFLYGCDRLGDELISTVSDVRTLGQRLLVIAGMRLLHFFNSRYSTLDECSFLPPDVLFWLKSLVTDPNCHSRCHQSSTIRLLEKIANLLYPDDSVNFKICDELLSALRTLED